MRQTSVVSALRASRLRMILTDFFPAPQAEL